MYNLVQSHKALPKFRLTGRNKVQDIENTAPIDEEKCILNLLATGQRYIREKATRQKLGSSFLFSIYVTNHHPLPHLQKCGSSFFAQNNSSAV